jgi:hypothetical protein
MGVVMLPCATVKALAMVKELTVDPANTLASDTGGEAPSFMGLSVWTRAFCMWKMSSRQPCGLQ